MGEVSKIEWCDSTFNPWVGCTKVGPGCDNCYAEALMDHRRHRVRWGSGNARSLTSAANWRLPLRWQRQAAEFRAEHGRRRRVFCASLADVFDNEVPDEWRNDLWQLIRLTPDLDWLLLTKRIGNVERMMPRTFPNVWLGATVVNQEEADRDIPKLVATPAAVRWLSCEPLLGAVDLRRAHIAPVRLPRVDWVVVGAESGAKARPMDLRWAMSLVEQCKAVDVPVFMKQICERGRKVPPHLWPVELQIREYPA